MFLVICVRTSAACQPYAFFCERTVRSLTANELMVVDVEVLHGNAIVLLLSGIADRGTDKLHSIEVGLANLLALLRRVATNDR